MLTANDYELAILVQDACDLSGVVHSFSEVLKKMNCMDTDSRNAHSICVMYASKIASLTHSENASIFTDAYHACVKGTDWE